jgi:hypothetical protein
MPACPASFFDEVLLIVRKDPGQAGMTDTIYSVGNRLLLTRIMRQRSAPNSFPHSGSASVPATQSKNWR